MAGNSTVLPKPTNRYRGNEMAGEIRWTYASQHTLEASGAEGASDVFVPANDSSLVSNSAIHLDYPWADFALYCDFKDGGVAAGSVIKLYRQPLDIQSTNDAPAPATTHKRVFVGSFVIKTGEGGASSPKWYPLTDVEIKHAQQYSIENKTDQSISAGWKLYATPKTYEPA